MSDLDLGTSILDAWHARGISVTFGEDDGGDQTLELDGPTEHPVDRHTVNEHAAAIAAALPTWKPPAERERAKPAKSLWDHLPPRPPDPVVYTLCHP